MAQCCLANGAEKVYSIDLSEPDDEFEALSKRWGGRLLAAAADVTREDTVVAAVERIVAEAGGLHGMVVNAGRTQHKAALDFTAEEIQSLFAVNVGDGSTWGGGILMLTRISVVRGVLLCAGRGESVHQAGGQGVDRLHGVDGFVSAQQGESRYAFVFVCERERRQS